MEIVFIAAAAAADDADDDDDDDDDNSDSCMRAASSDFQSGKLSDQRFHHISSFCVSPSFAAITASPFTTDYLRGSAARRPRDDAHARSCSLLIMTHLRAARVSDCRSLNRSSRRHRSGSEAINWNIDGAAARQRAVWILTCGDDDKRALRVSEKTASSGRGN